MPDTTIAGVNARARCRGCRERVPLSDGAVRELAARLRLRLTCPKCGASSEVSVLGGAPQRTPAAPTRPHAPAPPVEPPTLPQPVVVEPPFRPLIAPPTPDDATPAVPPPAVHAPFAPLEGMHGEKLTDPTASAREKHGAWSRLRPATQRLILVLAVLVAGGSAVALKKKKRPAPPPPAAQPAPPQPERAAPARPANNSVRSQPNEG